VWQICHPELRPAILNRRTATNASDAPQDRVGRLPEGHKAAPVQSIAASS
jgi:hypothetical protein